MDNSNFSNYQNQNLIRGENQIPSQEEIENNNNPISTNSNSSSQQKLSNNNNIYNYEQKEPIPLEVQQCMNENIIDKPGIIDRPKRSCCCDCCSNCCHKCCESCDECCSSQACRDFSQCLDAVGVCCQALNALASCQIF